jgi:hypothetical protein
VDVIGSLIDWTFINYSNLKGKNSPAGTRIYTLSVNLEILLSKISLSDDAVSQCLPILMKSVLKTDKALRELVKHNKINCERAS